MSPKATEGVGSTGLGLLAADEASASRAATPSGLPAISPTWGEISSFHQKIHRIDCANVSITLSFPEIRHQSGRETHREERLQALHFIADNG